MHSGTAGNNFNSEVSCDLEWNGKKRQPDLSRATAGMDNDKPMQMFYTDGVLQNETDDEEMDQVYEALCGEGLLNENKQLRVVESRADRVYGLDDSKKVLFRQLYNSRMTPAEGMKWVETMAEIPCNICEEFGEMCEPLIVEGIAHTRCSRCARLSFLCSWRDEYRKEVLMKKLEITSDAEYEMLLQEFLEENKHMVAKGKGPTKKIPSNHRPSNDTDIRVGKSLRNGKLVTALISSPVKMTQSQTLKSSLSYTLSSENRIILRETLAHMENEAEAILSAISPARLGELQILNQIANIVGMLKWLRTVAENLSKT
ncbi:hypothetical protein WG66_010747 [Moniliophthora roreri]|nr:hypothetical protein WG66_010747 [Moniliophthora roreri]